MADVTIKLQAATKEFTKAIEQSIKPVEELLKKLAQLTEAQAKQAAEERKAAAASRAAATARRESADTARKARQDANDQKKAAKEVADSGKAMLAESDRMKQLFNENEKKRLEGIESDKKKLEKETLAHGKAMLAESDRMKQLFHDNEKKRQETINTDKKTAEKEALAHAKGMLTESDRMKSMFLSNEKTRLAKIESDKQKLEKETLTHGKGMLAESDRMKRLFTENQRQLERTASEDSKKLRKDERDAQKRATQDALALQKDQLQATKDQAHRIALLTNAYQLLLRAGAAAYNGLKSAAASTLENIDQFQRGTIATAIAITNLAEPTLKFGKSWEQVFQRNLAFSKDIFIELERVAAQYFASATDLQLAYNTLAQRGVVIRREELSLLGQLTDTILLLTGGQQSSIQIQEEIRSLLTGSGRVTAQLAQVVKAFGLDVKEVAAQIRATQSLKPLEPILVGAKAANKEVQKTFQAVVNGLDVAFRQVERVAGHGFFDAMTASLQRLTSFINNNREAFVRFGAVLGHLTGKGIEGLISFFEKFTTIAGAKEAFAPIIKVIAVMQAGFGTLVRVGEALILVLAQVPFFIGAITEALSDNATSTEKTNTGWTIFGQQISGLNTLLTYLTTGMFGVAKAGIEAADAMSKAASEATAILPEGKTKRLLETLDKIKVKLSESFKGIDTRPFKEVVDEIEKELNEVAAKGVAGIGSLTPKPGTTPQPASPPFIEGEDSIAFTKRLNAELKSVTIRADRAQLAMEAFTERAATDITLQKLRRNFSLIQQGFELTEHGAVKTLNTVEGEMSKISTEIAERVQRGYVQMGLSLGTFSKDMEDISKRISAIQQQIDTAVYANLVEQASQATSGFQNFVQSVADNANELRDDTSRVSRAHADEILSEAEKAYDVEKRAVEIRIQSAQKRLDLLTKAETAMGRREISELAAATAAEIRMLEDQQREITEELDKLGAQALASTRPIKEFLKDTNNDKLRADLGKITLELAAQKTLMEDINAARTSTKATRPELIRGAQGGLETARQNEFIALKNAKEKLDILKEQARLQLSIGVEQDRKITADAELRIQERKLEILQNQLRITQQIQELRGQALQGLKVEAPAFVAQQKASAEAERPRTDIQQRFAPIVEAQVKFEEMMAKITGSINALESSQKVLTDTQSTAVVKQVDMAIQIAIASDEQKLRLGEQLVLMDEEVTERQAQILALEMAIPQLREMTAEIKKTGDEALASRLKTAGLKETFAGLSNAVDGIANTFTTALTDSFEGKATDFKRAMKGVADQMFKDGMKPMFDKLKESIGKGLEKAFEGVAPGMASTIGPAVMAGIGMIASFVLGQLMGDQGGEATAGNPTVGIQSTEQVRGLIGGETQIPIGQIGESLQDALVPTNSILLRIARAVEGQVAGLSPAQIEDVIGRAVGDALQIQGA